MPKPTARLERFGSLVTDIAKGVVFVPFFVGYAVAINSLEAAQKLSSGKPKKLFERASSKLQGLK